MRDKLERFVGERTQFDSELVKKLKYEVEMMGEEEAIWMRYFHFNENIKRKRKTILHPFHLEINCTTEQALKEFAGFVEFYRKQKES